MRRRVCFLLMLAAPVLAAADEPAIPADATRAFETAYAASFYEFDACGDGLSGRSYRRALSEKVAQCPFPAEVKQRFVLRAAAQRQKSAKAMAKLIEDNGGLPVRLDGMTRTCREQSETAGVSGYPRAAGCVFGWQARGGWCGAGGVRRGGDQSVKGRRAFCVMAGPGPAVHDFAPISTAGRGWPGQARP